MKNCSSLCSISFKDPLRRSDLPLCLKGSKWNWHRPCLLHSVLLFHVFENSQANSFYVQYIIVVHLILLVSIFTIY